MEYLSPKDLMIKLDESGLSYSSATGGTYEASDIFISKSFIGTTSIFYMDGTNIPFLDGDLFISTLLHTEDALSLRLFS